MEIYPILNKPGKGKYVFIFILNERAVHCERFARHSHAIPAVDCSVYGTYRSGQHHCSACQLPSYIRGSALRIGMPRLTARRASALASSGL